MPALAGDVPPLRASELRLEVERQQKMGWSTRLLEA